MLAVPRRVAAVAMFLALGASPSPRPAHPSPSPAASAGALLTSQGNYTIETDAENYNLNTGNFTMPHSVKFTRPGTEATADRAEGNTKDGTATLIGNVVIHDNGNAPEAESEKAYRGNGPATLDCDRLEVDSKKKIYTCIGNVKFEQKDEHGQADRAQLDRSSGKLVMTGNVKLEQNGSTLDAQNLDYDLNTKDVQVLGSPVVIKEPVPTPSPGAPGTPAPKKKRRLIP